KRRFDQDQPMKLGCSSPFHRLVINTDRPQANGILLQMSSTYITYVHFDTWETYLVIGRTPNELTSEISAFRPGLLQPPAALRGQVKELIGEIPGSRSFYFQCCRPKYVSGQCLRTAADAYTVPAYEYEVLAAEACVIA